MSVKKPKICIVATGGTIAGKRNLNGYKSGEISIEQILGSVPEIANFAEIETVQFSNIGSQNMSSDLLIKLAKFLTNLFSRHDLGGVVVTHGTDTMEESAYFLSLFLPTKIPVVLTGSMLPSDAENSDGPRNLLDAVKIAADPKMKNCGVVVSMAGELFSAKKVVKTNTQSVRAFSSTNLNEELKSEKSTLLPIPEKLAKVAILYGHVDSDPKMIKHLISEDYKGIVYAGVGHGNMNDETLNELAIARKNGVAVVRASRVFDGSVLSIGEIDDDAFGFVASGELNPQKARILLGALLEIKKGDVSAALSQFDKLK